MKKIKKTMVLAVMVVMLIGSCMTASAAMDGAKGCSHDHLSLYDKTEVHREFWFSHTEQHGATTVMCNVYKVEYLIRYRCDDCGALAFSTTKTEELHIN